MVTESRFRGGERMSVNLDKTCAKYRASERANKNRAIIHAHLSLLIKRGRDAAEGVLT
jgi:hypothetical protein